ncbi:hypothetical protein C0989_004816, partial [Termitomyces sp. Mn162]
MAGAVSGMSGAESRGGARSGRGGEGQGEGRKAAGGMVSKQSSLGVEEDSVLGSTALHPSRQGIGHLHFNAGWVGVDAWGAPIGAGAEVSSDGAVAGGTLAEECSRPQSMVE